jgi:hypothetical protein
MSALNLGSVISWLRIGLCAAQVGHQEAWMATKIGLPAFCAAAKASGVKASVSVVNASSVASRFRYRLPLGNITLKRRRGTCHHRVNESHRVCDYCIVQLYTARPRYPDTSCMHYSSNNN